MTRHTRLEQAEHIAVAEARWAAGETQRGVAAFVRTPDGMSWLHRTVRKEA